MNELALENDPGADDFEAAAEDAERGQVIYITRGGERLAAIVPAALAAALERMLHEMIEDHREIIEDALDAEIAREALAEIEAGAEPIPAEQAWAELGLNR